MKYNYFVLFILLLCIGGCSHSREEKTAFPITIDIQPFSDISDDYVMHVFNELSTIYSNVELKKKITLPKSAYYSLRNRYRADSLINYLRKITPENHITIGLTSKDISTTKNEKIDYGIMGLGYCPGKSCVTSIFRLSKTNRMNQLFKLSIHEHGHTQGLKHCPEKTCFMRDAEGKNHFDEESDFCTKCKNHLINNGWKFVN